MFELLEKLQNKLQLMILSEEEICNLLWGGFYLNEERGVYWEYESKERELEQTLEEICPKR